MGQCFATSVTSLPCANGIVCLHSRIQTQYTFNEGGDGMWYTGTITGLWSNSMVDVRYDDGDDWTGKAIYCYLLPSDSPGQSLPQPYGVPSCGGHVAPPGGGAEVVQAIPVMQAFAVAAPAAVRGRPAVGRPV